MATVAQFNAASVGAVACTPVLNGVVAGSGLGLYVATYSGAVTTPTGYTLDWSRQNATDLNGRLYHFRRENVASGTHSVALGTYSGGASAVLYEVRNTPTSATADGTPSAQDTTGTSIVTPSITIAANSLLVSGMTHVSLTTTLTEAHTLLFEQEDASAHMPISVQKWGDSAVGVLTAGTYTDSWTTGASVVSSNGIASWKNSGVAPTTLIPGFISSAETLYAPLIATTVIPGFIASGEVIYAPIVSLAGGPSTLVPGFISSGEVLYAPLIATVLIPGFVSSAELLYAPGLAAALVPGFIGTAEALYSPVITQTVVPGFIASAEALYAPSTVGAPLLIIPGFVSTGQALYNPLIFIQSPGVHNSNFVWTGPTSYLIRTNELAALLTRLGIDSQFIKRGI